MIKNFRKLEQYLVKSAKEMGKGCHKVFVAVSGGIDSSLVAAILCKAFGPKNVVGLYRNIKGDKKHKKDLELLQKTFGFKVIYLDLNNIYTDLLKKIKKEFKKNGLDWADENDAMADKKGLTNAYASFKSRLTTPLAGFISKAIDNGNGRIFGTGNGEEDGLLRYFDKYGDGAVDNNILAGLTKAEVRQLARHMGVPEKIIIKIPSADLEAKGDKHNDESQLTNWAKKMGYNIKISYGAADGSKEGNIAWAWKEDLKNGAITGKNSKLNQQKLMKKYGSREKTEIVLFLRDIERSTRHKVEPIPFVKRGDLVRKGIVD
jgi:NAD+ synthase